MHSWLNIVPLMNKRQFSFYFICSGIAGLSFANKGRRLYTVGSNGMASEIKSETGEVIKEFRLSKKSISSSVCSCGE